MPILPAKPLELDCHHETVWPCLLRRKIADCLASRKFGCNQGLPYCHGYPGKVQPRWLEAYCSSSFADDEFLQISQESDSIKEIIKTEHTKSKTNKTMANRGGRAAPAGGGKICQFKLVLLGTPRLQDYGHTTSCFRCCPPLLFSSSLLFLRPIILRRSVYGY